MFPVSKLNEECGGRSSIHWEEKVCSAMTDVEVIESRGHPCET